MKIPVFLFIVLILICSGLQAQNKFNPDKICRVEDGRLIFTLNLKWTQAEKKQLSDLFDLDSVLIGQVFGGKIVIAQNGESWNVKKIGPSIVELSKTVQSGTNRTMSPNDVFLMVDKWTSFAGAEPTSSVTFGVNKFEIANAFVYSNPIARFYLPGERNARKVVISGTFNNWSTDQTPMKFVGTGWMVDLKLRPGKYAYKFIVDGRWITDPSNKLRERGDAGSDNSVVYCYNHVFKLKGFKSADKAVVTGNFLNWSIKGLPMNRTADGWAVPVYLPDGTYAYKFLVDDRWLTDPDNPEERKDSNGNSNSILGIGEPFVFKLNGFTSAQKVILTGSFNKWDKSELVMDRTNGGWQLPYVIAAGNYEYKFIVDGRWTTDPGNPFSTGSGDFENSFIALKANHIFELEGYPDAKEIIVTGSFNRWSTKDYRMKYQNGRWIFPISLNPGKYTYKFIVDGKWIIDPGNKLYEQNEYGTYNTVLWIDVQE